MLIAVQRMRMDELKAKAEEVEAEVKVLKKEAARQLASGSDLKTGVAANEVAVEELRGKRADILEAAQMQQAWPSCLSTACLGLQSIHVPSPYSGR